jgi:hypothetical protein
MNKAERMAFTETHPGVTRLKTPHPCEGWKSGTPSKAIYNWGPGRQNPPIGLDNYRCKNPAYWRFVPLKRKWTGETEPRRYCWSHLLHGGLYGDMDEEARTERWLKRMEAKRR